MSTMTPTRPAQSPQFANTRKTPHGALLIRTTPHSIQEIIMHDHAGHNSDQPTKPDSSTTKTPEKPVQADPHAGHDMGKSATPATPAKGPSGK